MTDKVPKLEVPDGIQKSITSKSSSIVDQAKAITISSDNEYSEAGDFLTTVVLVAISELNDAFDPIISDWHQGHRRTIATKRKLETPLRDAEKAIKGAMAAWSREKVRRQQEEVRRLQAAAREEAERRAEEELLEKIEKALEEDDEEESDRLSRVLNGEEVDIDEYGREIEKREIEEIIPLPVVADKPKAEGVSIRMLKKYRVIDEGKIKREFLMVDEKKIQRVVTAMGEAAEKIVGEGSIKVYEEESVAGRMRR